MEACAPLSFPSSVADTQKCKSYSDLLSSGFAHGNALSVALKLFSNPLCSIATKVKVTNHTSVTPDELHFSHTLGPVTLKEDVNSHGKYHLQASYQINADSNLTVDVGMPDRTFQVLCQLNSGMYQCQMSCATAGLCKFSGSIGKQELGGSADVTWQSGLLDYSLALYAKNNRFELMFRNTHDKTTHGLGSFYASYHQHISSLLSLFVLAQYDTEKRSKKLDVSGTCKINSKDSLRFKLNSTGDVYCSAIHKAGRHLGVACGLKTSAISYLKGEKPNVKFGAKVKIG